MLPEHVLEVTEHERIADYTQLTERLRVLASRGSLVAVDDVGAGYANMAHVLRLSPHFIKIDRGIVSGLHRDRDRRALIAALVAFAVACGAQTIAEGVEEVAELTGAHRSRRRPRPGLPHRPAGHRLARAGAYRPRSRVTARRWRCCRSLPGSIGPGTCRRWPTSLPAGSTKSTGSCPASTSSAPGCCGACRDAASGSCTTGWRPASGITGTAFVHDAEAWVPDVRLDPDLPRRHTRRALGVLRAAALRRPGDRRPQRRVLQRVHRRCPRAHPRSRPSDRAAARAARHPGRSRQRTAPAQPFGTGHRRRPRPGRSSRTGRWRPPSRSAV